MKIIRKKDGTKSEDLKMGDVYDFNGQVYMVGVVQDSGRQEGLMAIHLATGKITYVPDTGAKVELLDVVLAEIGANKS